MLPTSALFSSEFSNRFIPSSKTFTNIFISESDRFKYTTTNRRPRSIKTKKIEEVVLQKIEKNPKATTRKIVSAFNVYYNVWGILKLVLDPHYLQIVHALDIELSHCYPHKVTENPQF